MAGMTDSFNKARKQLSRQRALRRWLPSVVVSSAATIGVGLTSAWVWSASGNASPAAIKSDQANTRLATQVTLDQSLLSHIRSNLSSAENQLANLPQLASPNGAASSLGTLPPLSALPAVGPISGLAPAVHATTGASGAP